MKHKQSTLCLALAFGLMVTTAMGAGSPDTQYNINDFKRSYFKIITLNSGFYTVNDNLNTLKDHQPLLYGYIDKDLYTDVITVSKDRKSTSFFFYNDVEGVFEKKLDGPTFPSEERIVSAKLTVAASTASYPDVIYITENTSDFSLTMRLYKLEYQANGLVLIEVPSFKVQTKNVEGSHQEPINFQIFGAQSVTDYWLVNDQGQRKIITFNRTSQQVETSNFSDVLDSSCDGCMSPDLLKDRNLNTIGTNGFIDIDRDCRADLILESTDHGGNKSLEFFIFNSSGKFGLKKIIPIDKNFSIGSFIDIDQNNTIDLVFWDKSQQKLVTYFSLLEGADKLDSSTECLDKGLPFSFPSLENKDDKRFVTVQDLVANAQLVENPDLKIFSLLRFADLDLDGYMDLLVNLKVNGKNEVFIFKNSPCILNKNTDAGNAQATDLNTNPLLVPECRIFIVEPDSEKISVLKNKNAIQSSLFDFGERGLLYKKNRHHQC